MLAWIAAAWPGQALVCQGTGLAHFGGEVGNETFLLAGAMDCLGLPLWAGDFHGLAVFIELDGKVGQVQLFRIGSDPANGGLNMFDLLFLQDLIGSRATMPAIGVVRQSFPG
jgi:hypothetical protein